MAKKYYWLKLKKDFFISKEMKKLRKIAGGDTYTVIYLKMLLLSIENDGNIYFDNVEEDLVKELALVLDEEEDNVKVALVFLEKMGLIKEIEADKFELIEAKESIGQETATAERVRKHRKNKETKEEKKLLCNTQVTQPKQEETKSNTEKRREREEKELDKENKELFVETKVSTQKFENNSVEILTSKYLSEKILKLNPNTKVPKTDLELQKWARHVDLMLRVDKRPLSDLREVLKFATTDTFWQSNILSTKKLRDKYDQLYLKMIKEREVKANGSYARTFGNDDEYSNIKSFKL